MTRPARQHPLRSSCTRTPLARRAVPQGGHFASEGFQGPASGCPRFAQASKVPYVGPQAREMEAHVLHEGKAHLNPTDLGQVQAQQGGHHVAALNTQEGHSVTFQAAPGEEAPPEDESVPRGERGSGHFALEDPPEALGLLLRQGVEWSRVVHLELLPPAGRRPMRKESHHRRPVAEGVRPRQCDVRARRVVLRPRSCVRAGWDPIQATGMLDGGPPALRF